MYRSEKQYIESLTDRQVVEAILCGDEKITVLYLYKYCYPLFKAYYNKFEYCLEAVDCRDFISGFYIYLMTPGEVTRRSKLATFSYRCSLLHWIKCVLVNYCLELSKKSEKRLKFASFEEVGDRIKDESESLPLNALDRDDIEVVLHRMSNTRYRNLIRFRYVDGLTNNETAQLLEMSMENYYNKKRLAIEQFVSVLRKERLV